MSSCIVLEIRDHLSDSKIEDKYKTTTATIKDGRKKKK